MPGNRKSYQEAMSIGAQAAWDQEWGRAIEAYQRAIAEFPEDPAAYVSVGLALLQSNRLKEALDAYVRAHQLAPDDHIPLERSADVYERLGMLDKAAENYVKVAEILLGRRDVQKAIGNWERATRLSPGMLNIHSRLALAYERTGRRKAAVREYLTIAAIYQRRGDGGRAIQACRRALKLDKNNPQVLNAMHALQVGHQVQVKEKDKPKISRDQIAAFGAAPSAAKPAAKPTSEADLKGPVGEAQEHALAELATHLFESGIATQQSGMFAAQAIDMQRAGELGAAIAAYQRAGAAGLSHPAFALNLGSLLVEYGDYETGVEVLKGALRDHGLAAGAYFAMAQAYMALDNQRETIRHLLSALKLVQMSDQPPALADDAIYAGMLRSAAQMPDDRLSAFNQSLLAFMTGPEWRKNVTQTRAQLREAARLDGEAALLEMLATDQTGRIAAIMSRIDSYRKKGLYAMAMDEAQYAIQIAPFYLPAHIRIAEILFDAHRVRPAIQKYNIVAETYRVRGETKKAADILSQLLKMAPMDVSVRKKRLQWLEEEGRWLEMFDEYINLADTYYDLADWDNARTTYREAEALAEKAQAPAHRLVHLLLHLADIDVQRLEMRPAMEIYQRIKKLAPDDERTRRILIDMHYRVGNGANALTELDDLLRLYARQREIDKITEVLEELVTLHPDEMGLRSRLARVYQQQRRLPDAVRQLDALGELQLEAGLRDEAIQTIRTIVAMNPPDRQSYLQLLQQLGQ
ncbi:MAG: tetratricopeptide repeat protein [Anaerolineae bacterium]|nr:tetratricopeptide repeat protein [Anaerolineae bacterium]